MRETAPAAGTERPGLDAPDEAAFAARIRGVIHAEMARVRARLAILSGRDPAERPRVPAVLRLPVAPSRRPPKDGIVVAPGWGEPRDLLADAWGRETRSRPASG